MHYVYKIINNINEKYYIGKRKSNTPHKDAYMGSGKLITAAINKYGKSNFTKIILKIFETDDEAAEYEKFLVTKEIVDSNNSYNLHIGGHGGFEHINKFNVNERPNIKKIKYLKHVGVKFGGRSHFTEEGEMRSNKALELNRINGCGKLSWINMTDEKRELRKKNLSNRMSGNNNPNANKCWCVQENAIDKLNRKMYNVDTIPEGWIKIHEYNKRNNIRN